MGEERKYCFYDKWSNVRYEILTKEEGSGGGGKAAADTGKMKSGNYKLKRVRFDDKLSKMTYAETE